MWFSKSDSSAFCFRIFYSIVVLKTLWNWHLFQIYTEPSIAKSKTTLGKFMLNICETLYRFLNFISHSSTLSEQSANSWSFDVWYFCYNVHVPYLKDQVTLIWDLEKRFLFHWRRHKTFELMTNQNYLFHQMVLFKVTWRNLYSWDKT